MGPSNTRYRSVAGAAESRRPEVAVPAPVVDTLAVPVALVLIGTAETLGSLKGRLGLGPERLLEASGGEAAAAANELPHGVFLSNVPGRDRAWESLTHGGFRTPSPIWGSLCVL